MRNYMEHGKANSFPTINLLSRHLDVIIMVYHTSIPVYHLNTGIEEPININISLNRKNM